MKSIFSRRTIFLILIIINVVLLVLAFVQSQSFFSVAIEAGELQSKINDFNRKKIKVKKFDAKKIEQEKETLKKILSDKALVFEVIKEVKRIAKTLEVAPIKVSLSTEEPKQFKQLSVDAVSFKMKFRCTYGQFVKFTQKLEEMPYLITVDSLEVLRSKDALPGVDVIMNISAYEETQK